jgi:AraC-like DNA-binding protein
MEHFISNELLKAIAAIDAKSFVGPWPATLAARRTRKPFVAKFLSEDHSHSHAEICQLLSGSCTLSYRFKRYRLSAGDLGFFPPNIPHSETFWRSNLPYRMAWWIFARDCTIAQATEYRAGRFKIVDRIVLKPLGQDIREASRRLIRYTTASNPPRAVAVKEALLTISLCLIRKILGNEAADARHAVIRDAQEYIRKHVGSALCLSEVARAVMLSPNYLTSLFRAKTGVSLGNYIKRKRIARAKQLLAGSRRSIKDISYALGFEDPYTFSRTFKRVEGISPLQYRTVHNS